MGDCASLSLFLEKGLQAIGGRPLLDKNQKEDLKCCLTTLDACQMQQTVAGTASLIQSFAGSLTLPAKSTVHKYIKETGLHLKKPHHADEGRVRSIESVEGFLEYFDILEENLEKIRFDPYLIFGVDEVGVQFAEHEVTLVTSCEYLNKMIQKQTVHCTLTLCTSPAAGGTLMTPHFLFQQPEGDT